MAVQPSPFSISRIRTAENSEGTASPLLFFSFTKSAVAQDFRQERGVARCYFAAETAKTAKTADCTGGLHPMGETEK